MITKDAFVSKFHFICEDLRGMNINEVVHSIGSTVEFGFGENCQILSDGKPYQRRSRIVWIYSTNWRITQHGRYIVGSCDEYDEVHWTLKSMMGRRLQSMKITSRLMDLQIVFDEGYVIDTFHDEIGSKPWILFHFSEDLSFEMNTEVERKEMYELSKAFDIPNIFTPIHTDVDGLSIIKTELLDSGRVILHVRHDLALILDMCVWRLFKNGEWITGCFAGGWDPEENCSFVDDEQIRCCLYELEGKIIKQIEVANNMLDARFYIGDEYTLETFVCCVEDMNRWGIYPGVPEPSFYAPLNSVFENTTRIPESRPKATSPKHRHQQGSPLEYQEKTFRDACRFVGELTDRPLTISDQFKLHKTISKKRAKEKIE